MTRSEYHHPPQPCSREILTIALPHTLTYTIYKQLGLRTVRIYFHHFLFANLSPTYRPAMAINMGHGFLGPIRLENIVRFLLVEVSLHYTFLIHIGHGILRSDRGGKIFERPIGGAGKPRHGFLFFEVPVDKVADVTFAPIAVFRHPCRSPEQRRIACSFVSRCTVHHRGQAIVRVLRVTPGMAIAAPFDVEKMIDLFELGSRGGSIVCVNTAVPTRPYRG